MSSSKKPIGEEELLRTEEALKKFNGYFSDPGRGIIKGEKNLPMNLLTVNPPTVEKVENCDLGEFSPEPMPAYTPEENKKQAPVNTI